MINEEEIRIEALCVLEDDTKAVSTIDSLIDNMDVKAETTIITGHDFTLEMDNKTGELINGIGEATSREYQEGERYID